MPIGFGIIALRLLWHAADTWRGRLVALALVGIMPPFVRQSIEEQGRGSKRVSNRKLKMELGYQFKYPTFRQGCTAEIQRLEEEGKL